MGNENDRVNTQYRTKGKIQEGLGGLRSAEAVIAVIKQCLAAFP